MLAFNSATGFEASEVTDIRDSVAEDWINAFAEDGRPALDVAPETPQGQIIDSQTAAISQKDAEVLYLAQQFNPRTAQGIFQDALAKIYFLTRKPAINSTATCELTGRQGTQIPAGALIQSEHDGSQWELNEDLTIPAAGVIAGVFTSKTAGAVSAAAGTLSRIITTVPGWDSVTNPAAASVGQLEESQAAFEARRYASVALNSRGTEASVYARVADVDGVTSIYVTGNRTSAARVIDGYTLTPHSVYVAAIGGADSDIAKAIYESLSAGCDMNGNTAVSLTDPNTGAQEEIRFERPADFPVYLRVRLYNNGNLPNGYEDTIRQAVLANFYATTETVIAGEAVLRVKMGDDIYSSRFLPSVLNAGIVSLLGIDLSTDGAAWVDSIHIPISGAPLLTEDQIQIEVQE